MLNLVWLPPERQRALLRALRASRELESVRHWEYGLVFVRELRNGMCVVNANALTLLLSGCDPTADMRLYLLTCDHRCAQCSPERYSLPPEHPHYPRFFLRHGVWHVSVWCPAIAQRGSPVRVEVPLPHPSLRSTAVDAYA